MEQKNNPKQVVSGTPHQPRSKQTVTITDDLKAIIRSNNGLIDGEGKSAVAINGEYSISADSVRRLSTALQGKNIYVVRGLYPPTGDLLTSDEYVHQTITELRDKNKELHDESVKARTKYQSLLNELRAFNASRRPWERKIEIPE